MAESDVRVNRFIAIILMVHLVKIGSLELAGSCLDHNNCPESLFCAVSKCTDDFGRNFSCGECKPCVECRCHVDAFDGSCPQQRCPNQPTDGVRFLQGPFHAFSLLPGVTTHFCVRRLLFTSGTFSDIQAAVRVDHPASAAPANLSALSELCPSFVRIGAVVNTTFREDGTFAVDVFVSSEGRAPRRRSANRACAQSSGLTDPTATPTACAHGAMLRREDGAKGHGARTAPSPPACAAPAASHPSDSRSRRRSLSSTACRSPNCLRGHHRRAERSGRRAYPAPLIPATLLCGRAEG
jgi:hypothetical protein